MAVAVAVGVGVGVMVEQIQLVAAEQDGFLQLPEVCPGGLKHMWFAGHWLLPVHKELH